MFAIFDFLGFVPLWQSMFWSLRTQHTQGSVMCTCSCSVGSYVYSCAALYPHRLAACCVPCDITVYRIQRCRVPMLRPECAGLFTDAPCVLELVLLLYFAFLSSTSGIR